MDRTLRVAIITNDHFRVEAVTTAIAGLHWQVMSGVGQPQPLAWLQRTAPDVVLVDLDLTNAIGLLREITENVPKPAVLALATPQHLVELQDALTAGAASFVAFPIDANQLASTVQRVVQESALRPVEARRGRIVVLAGLKGGVGRSTLAVNLAVALRQHVDGDVVLVEGHHGLSDLSLMLNMLPRHTLASLAQESNLDIDVLQGHLQGHASKIKILAAPADLAQLVELPVETWRQVLTHLAETAPYVIVDTAPVADPVLSEVLTLADDVVVVAGPELPSLRSSVALIQSLEEEDNVHARIHVVLNRAGVRGGIGERAAATQLGETIMASVPDDPALATFAVNRGVPFVLSHPRAHLSRRMHELAGQIFDLRTARKPALQPQHSLLRLGKRLRPKPAGAPA